MKLYLLLVVLLIAGSSISTGLAFADPLLNANKQRIGNYDFEMTTEPKSPAVGTPTKILLRIAGVNGDDLVDVPLVIRIVKDGVELQRTNPIIVPYGHHTHEFSFPEPGRYVLYVDLKDYSYSGEILTFTFLINVGSQLDYLLLAVPAVGGAIAVAGAIVFAKKKKHRVTMS
ncbi:MAG TPA: hypothetical protein VLA68_04725 [Nitrososphaera sp.]|nr:hypothetical protein [Nitrososphaera sp.]